MFLQGKELLMIGTLGYCSITLIPVNEVGKRLVSQQIAEILCVEHAAWIAGLAKFLERINLRLARLSAPPDNEA